MFCPNCGKELDSSNVCSNPNCPSYIDNNNHRNETNAVNNQGTAETNNVTTNQYNSQNYNNNYGYNQTYPTSQNFNNSNFAGDNSFRDRNGISASELMEFVGESKSHYYMEQWQKAQDNESFTSWNWPAFFTTFLWFWYRKMYGLAASIFGINLVLNIIATVVFSALTRPSLYSSSYYYSSYSRSSTFNWPVLLIGLVIRILCGLFANQFYIKHVTKKIRSIKSTASMGVDNDTIFRRLRLTGGTTIAPIIFAIVIGVLFLLLIIIGIIAASSSYRYSRFY